MRLLVLILLSFIFLNAQVLLKEDFNSLENWEPLHFEKIEKHSSYEVQNSILITSSKASAYTTKQR